jgi:hypothetical protein
MKYIIDKDLVKQASLITGHKYDVIDGVIITSDAVEFMIEQLIDRYNQLEEKFFEYAKDVEENYVEKKVDPYLEYGVSESDFH